MRGDPGGPRCSARVQVAQVKAVACTPPTEVGQPLSRWSCPELARQAVSAGICPSISSSTVRRWLAEDALKPWQYQSWIFITDPDFRSKAQRVLDLYQLASLVGRRYDVTRAVSSCLSATDALIVIDAMGVIPSRDSAVRARHRDETVELGASRDRRVRRIGGRFLS